MSFIGLIVRCKDEPYVFEFVHYYIKQGIDNIYIIDDNSNKEIYKDVINNKKVNILFSNISEDPHKSGRVNKLYKYIKNDYKWIIYIDMDEYIITKKNSNNTIKEELETTFNDCMCIKIPWVMMSCNSIKKSPESLLKTNIYRWNHDNKHINTICNDPKFRCRYNEIECKCIFKPEFFDDIFDHLPINPNCNNIKIVESVKNTTSNYTPFYENLREKDIKEGYLLCYHYRIVSIENCLNKIQNNIWYKKYKLTDLLSNDYPEIIDETFKLLH
uniref:Glycosyltransferase 2-like domain-containing protein n=1 Tax=viral metagenome TaxID=1070528 RepID=A0A6C0EUR6_9ZZZZ